jgi:predicted nucleic acid-binding protein
VAGHDLIHGELLISDRGRREALLTGWVDAHLLASALVANVSIWTADERLANVAR